MRLGPGGPFNLNLASGSYLGYLGAGRRVLVASNLGGVVVHGGLDEAVVEALGARPLDDLRSGILVLEGRVVGLVVLAVHVDGGKVAVCADGGNEGTKKGSSLHSGRHCFVWL